MDSNSDVETLDSDEELQVAFANNLLKPGLNIEVQPTKVAINRKDDMENILKDFHLNLKWVERLDHTSGSTTKESLEQLNGDSEQASVNNDFQRELCFYKQAQSAVLDVMPKLHGCGISTKRPEDYFAEMAKSDLHMKRIREKLISQELGMERSEKAKKLRAARKFGKQVQIDVLKKRAQEKKKMLEEVKKYRKGQKDKLDFLEELESEGKGQPNKGRSRKRGADSESQHQPNNKRKSKNERFGFGGKKKWSKSNSAKSFDKLSPLESMMMNQSSRKQNQINKPKRGQKQKRLGKNRRQQNKSRNNRK